MLKVLRAPALLLSLTAACRGSQGTVATSPSEQTRARIENRASVEEWTSMSEEMTVGATASGLWATGEISLLRAAGHPHRRSHLGAPRRQAGPQPGAAGAQRGFPVKTERKSAGPSHRSSGRYQAGDCRSVDCRDRSGSDEVRQGSQGDQGERGGPSSEARRPSSQSSAHPFRASTDRISPNAR